MTALWVSEVSASAIADWSQLLAASKPLGPPLGVTPNPAEGLDCEASPDVEGPGRAADCSMVVSDDGALLADTAPFWDIPGTGGRDSLTNIFCILYNYNRPCRI